MGLPVRSSGPDAHVGQTLMRALLDIVRQSLATLWAHKLRSFLTMFGIAWGVGSLLLLVGLGEGFRSGQQRNLAELGQDIMFGFPGRIPAVEGPWRGPARRRDRHQIRRLPTIHRDPTRRP